ncbi:hypothetical protein K493DRAFT_340574 [Basidiobolus meristosporus CBS 931.73]|uniref:Uncharacterized protein n=1 Tax=Basidiobolus meristosporus CBS 931.73 TaxID=1314790 RepID=A0A1Y1XVL8_9FUNG|nr:hypothetical protein K493DRAFT_340574 [Basidiobolus meristosporus CBS 931.73]|eukprot:ORX89526.1 hypothetical protein K493DRAFT_340574 [Basidiobolus meristosporus CBS 931.73]
MPASANTAPRTYPTHPSENIPEYEIKKSPLPNHSKYPVNSASTYPLAFGSSGGLSYSSVMEHNFSPLQNPTNPDFTTDKSILPSPPDSSQDNFASDFSKLDTLAAAAGSILVSLANFGQTTPTAQHSEPHTKETVSNAGAARDVTQHSDNLADLAAAAVSSLSDLATPQPSHWHKHAQEQEQQESPPESVGRNRGGFMSISALLDEGSSYKAESGPGSYNSLFQGSDGNRFTSKAVDDQEEHRSPYGGVSPSKRLISESELSPNKRHSPSKSAYNRNNLVNDTTIVSTTNGYPNATALEKSMSLPQSDGTYANSNRNHSTYQAHEPALSVPEYRGSQPFYQPLKADEPNAFSKKYQSMQDPKVKRNATHAYIAYMIYTDRLQPKDADLKASKSTASGSSADLTQPTKPTLDQYGHPGHLHNHPYPYTHNHGHSQHAHTHVHPTHNHPPQHSHATHQHHTHQHQRPHSHPHTHQHQHLYHHHHSHDQRSQPSQATTQPYNGNPQADSRFSRNPSRYEPRDSTASTYYQSYERSSGPPYTQSSGQTAASRSTPTGFPLDSNYGSPYRRDSTSSSTYAPGAYSQTSNTLPSAYPSDMRYSQSGRSYNAHSPQMSPRAQTDSRYTQKSMNTSQSWQPDPSNYSGQGRPPYRT